MKSILTKKYRYENSVHLLLGLISFICYLLMLLSSLQSNISSNNILPIIMLVLTSISVVLIIVSLCTNKLPYIVKKISFITIDLITLVLVVDIILLGLINSFIVAANLPNKPNSSYSLATRLAYIIMNDYSMILGGVATTLWLSLAGTIVGLLIALVFSTIRTLEVNKNDNEFIAFLKKIGSGFVHIYVTVFRGTPMMVQAIIIYYFLPGILSGIFGISQATLNAILSVSVAGFITVSLNTTAYLTEVLRGGITSLNKGQTEGALSLGFSKPKAMIYIVLPQAIKNQIPAICNEFIINIKDTSVLSVISVMDLFFVIDTINGRSANQDAIFIAAIIYLILTYSISKILRQVEKRLDLVAKPIPSSN